jgi:chemotaxis protein MotA
VTPIGIAASLIAIVVSMTMDHGNVMDLINIPALLLVVGGSVGATVAGFDGRHLRAVPKALKLIMLPGHGPDMRATIDMLLSMAKEVRQNPLVLEQLETDDLFLKKGIQLITSTSDPERVHELLGAEVHGLRSRHQTATKFFSDLSGFSPTFGILGTVIGLIGVLGQLANPGKLGPAIASAFTATLWGVLLANAVWLPISNRLRRQSEEEVSYREMVIEGLLTMQLNASSMDLKDRLYAFLPPSERVDDAVPASPTEPSDRADAAA